MAKKIDKISPIFPPDYDKSVVKAIQRLASGEASEEQQKKALEWIIHKACGTYDLPYRPGGEEGHRDTNVALGRMFVGQQIVKMINLNSLAFDKLDNDATNKTIKKTTTKKR